MESTEKNLTLTETEEIKYQDLVEFAVKENLPQLAKALPLVKEAFAHCPANQHGYTGTANHCFSVCWMLNNLRLRVSHEELDRLLTAALCHALPSVLNTEDAERELTGRFGLEKDTAAIVLTLMHGSELTDEETASYYKKLQGNPCALMIRLVDRGNILERLYTFPIWRSNRYIDETIAYYFPLCIYAKEHYPEMQGAVSIMMEKIKSLLEVGEILITRFSAQEKQMQKEIMTLREENARILGSIKLAENG